MCVQLGQRILASLDTKAEREAAAAQFAETLKDGKITTIEWTQLGKSLGIFKGNGRGKHKHETS
jgi:hypothetical protein